MTVDVTVALVGDPDSPPPGPIDEPEWQRAWDDRAKVTLLVEDDETLSEVIDRAATAFGCQPWISTLSPAHTFAWVAFDDAAATTPLYTRKIYDFTLVDSHGEAVFGIHDFHLIPYGQIIRSAEAGLVPGNPRRLYIIRQIPQGDFGTGVSWQTLLELYALIRIALDVVSTTEDLKDRTASAARIIRKGIDGFRRHSPRWGQRNTRPEQIRKLVRTRAWSSEQLSALLACPEIDLADVLALLGFERDSSDGTWKERRRGQEPLLDDLEDELREGDYKALDWTIDNQQLLTDRVGEIVRHGREVEARPIETYRLPEEELFPGRRDRPSLRLRFVWFVQRILRV
jgi:hypothetical protein